MPVICRASSGVGQALPAANCKQTEATSRQAQPALRTSVPDTSPAPPPPLYCPFHRSAHLSLPARLAHLFDCKEPSMADNARLSVGGKDYELPVVVGTENERGIDIGKLLASSGHITLDD